MISRGGVSGGQGAPVDRHEDAAKVPTFCRSCGHNLSADRALNFGPLAFDPLGVASWRGNDLRLTGGEHNVLGTLALAEGSAIAGDIIAERLGYEGDGNVVQVLLSRIRRKLRSAGAPATALKTLSARGYFLDVALLREIAPEPLLQSTILERIS